jgi:hypothetical protein
VAKARDEMVQQVIGKLAAVGTLATDTLHQLLSSKSDAVRLGAARATLEHMFRGHELHTLAQRVAALEARDAAANGLRKTT